MWWHFRQWEGVVRLILPCCHYPHCPEGKSERLCGWRLRVELSLVAVNQNAQQGAWTLAGPRWVHYSRSQARIRHWASTSSECLLCARHWAGGLDVILLQSCEVAVILFLDIEAQVGWITPGHTATLPDCIAQGLPPSLAPSLRPFGSQPADARSGAP